LKEKKERKWEKRSKEKKHKKAMKATWSDSSDESQSESDSSDDEVANLCLMAHEDEVQSSYSSSNDSSSDNDDDVHEFTYEELEKSFGDLLEAYEKNHDRYVKLKKKHACMTTHFDTLTSNIDELKNENESLKLEIDMLKKGKSIDVSHDLEIENDCLKKKVETLMNDLANFTNGRDNLEKLLSSQRCVYDKAGLGYNPENKQKISKICLLENLHLIHPIYVLLVVGTHTHQNIVHLGNHLLGRNLLGFLREPLCMLTKMDPTNFGYQKKHYANV